MTKYKLSNEAKEDLIRIYQYGIKRFGMNQADKYFDSFFDYFEIIAKRPLSFEAVDFIKPEDIEDVYAELILSTFVSLTTLLK